MAEDKKKKTDAPVAPSAVVAPQPQAAPPVSNQANSFLKGIKELIDGFLKNSGLDKLLDKIKEALGIETKSKPEQPGSKPPKKPEAEPTAKPAEPDASPKPKPAPEAAPSQRPVAAPAPAEPATTDPKVVETEVKDPDLKKFYDSLSPEQVEMQKKIAALGGSQPQGEILGIAPGLPAERYALEKRLGSTMYDGPFDSKEGISFPYEPSEEVGRLMKKFKESLTPEQKALFDKYGNKERESLKSFRDMDAGGIKLEGGPPTKTDSPNDFTRLLRENVTEMTGPLEQQQGATAVRVDLGLKDALSGP